MAIIHMYMVEHSISLYMPDYRCQPTDYGRNSAVDVNYLYEIFLPYYNGRTMYFTILAMVEMYFTILAMVETQ